MAAANDYFAEQTTEHQYSPLIRWHVRLVERAPRLELAAEAFFRGRAPVLLFDVGELEGSGLAIEGSNCSHQRGPVADRGEHPGPRDGASGRGRRQGRAAFHESHGICHNPEDDPKS